MGTRADFYIGKGESAEWLGSIAWDGYPEGLPPSLAEAKTEEEFRKVVGELSERKDWTAPERGWPWPWENSATTDYAYAFSDGAVWASYFGDQWVQSPSWGKDDVWDIGPKVQFPNMKERQNVRFDGGSGLIIIEGQ